MRQIFTTLAIAIVLVGIGAVVYFYLFANTADITVAPTGNTGLPIAGQNIPVTETGGSLATSTEGAPIVVTTRLVKISEGPVVAGAAIIDRTVASSSNEVAVRYIERQSGNVFSYNPETGIKTRISNKTIPGIQSAEWIPDASLAFVRYLSGDDFSTINTYALPTNGSSGFFLAQNIADIAVSSTSILTLASGVNGSVASVGRIDGTNTKEVFSTPLSALRVSFAGKSNYLAYTKPSATLSGDVFLVNSAGLFSRIAGPANGMTALASHSGKWILVSSVSNGALQMKMVSTETGESVALPIATITDKCVWSADDTTIYCGIPVDPSVNNAYPDDWYQGVVSFSDRLWKIDVAGRYAQLVLDFPKESKSTLDAVSLAVDPLNTELVFKNKLDGSLWGYQL